MENIKTEISSKGILTITIDLKKKGRLSKSEKTIVIASTLGNVDLEGNKRIFKFGLNIYKDRG